jgi:hypothetical protein
MVTKAKPSAGLGGAEVSDYVIAAIDNPWDTAQAEEALRKASSGGDAIVVRDGWQASSQKHIGRRRTAADQFAALLAAQGPDVLCTCVLQQVLQQVRRGHAVRAVYAPEPQEFECAIRVLEGHHAQAV